VVDLGRLEYAAAYRLQEQLRARRIAGEIEDVVLLVEHDPVFTLGRRATGNHLLADETRLAQEGIAVHETNRGGDITYHGPGQLVGYPILDLRALRQSVHGYVRNLEEVLIRTVADYGVAAGRIEGLTGVWVGNEKIAAIGVAIRHWVSMHGFALNVAPNLAHFDLIVPCGIADKGVTSLAKVLCNRGGASVPAPSIAEVKPVLTRNFGEVFGLDFRFAISDFRFETWLDHGFRSQI
jgi:lipoate-protein ligase B